MKIFFLGLIVFLSVATGLFFVKGGATNVSDSLQKLVPAAVPTPSPMPFYEMTIPSLRTRSYNGELGELKEYEQRAGYTSYLTSYSSDGLKINGLLTIPKGESKKHPAIVFVHGYIAPTIYKTTQRYVDYVDYLARNGFVVFKIDLRGHGESEGDATGSYYSGDYVVDTLNAYAALQKASFVNSEAIGLWGHSMAGNITMRAFAAKPTIPAVVVWAGAGYTYTDLLAYRLNDRSYRAPTTDTKVTRRRQLLNETHGTFSPTSDFWKTVAITDYLGDLRGALELHHAVDDSVVSVEYSRNLEKLLDSTSIPHSLFEYTSGGHNLDGNSFGAAMRRTVDFYKKHLQ